ncbi:hypothetical protein SAMN05421751_104240 [Jhaorihella thermophila]|uniref:Uncharacterized protein n=1 Tax=Jhaorihella thermophila TaxID=488547 RepID=A0A1H5UTC2_9RHOB|nr:hypothetical protein SAMN05421751_104240 [Jhaorihella thermophila]
MTTKIKMLAIDLAKGSFQVCAVGPEGRVWMPPVLASVIFGLSAGVFDRTCVRPLSVAFHDATGRYAVRKAGFTSVQRAASARAPGLNLPP